MAETVKLAEKWGEQNTCFGSKYCVMYLITSLRKLSIQINEDEKAICDDVDEATIAKNIVEGPPAAGCTEDNQR